MFTRTAGCPDFLLEVHHFQLVVVVSSTGSVRRPRSPSAVSSTTPSSFGASLLGPTHTHTHFFSRYFFMIDELATRSLSQVCVLPVGVSAAC